MLAVKRPHIFWSIGRSVDRRVVIKPALVFVSLPATFFPNLMGEDEIHFRGGERIERQQQRQEVRMRA